MSDFWRSLKTRILDEGGIDEIFSHLRNLLVATVIIAAGAFAVRQPVSVELFGVLSLDTAGYGVAAVGVALVGLNLLDGWYKLTMLGSPLAVRVALVVLYLFITTRLVQLVVLLRSG